jgi:hypothetical protein
MSNFGTKTTHDRLIKDYQEDISTMYSNSINYVVLEFIKRITSSEIIFSTLKGKKPREH